MIGIRKWHRRLGLLSFVMVIWLAVSGLMINHGDDLGLNKSRINLSWLNQMYGLDSRLEVNAVKIGQTYFFCLNGNLYKDMQKISACESSLKSVSLTEKYLLLLSEAQLFVLSSEGELYESLAFSLFNKHFIKVHAVSEQVLLTDENETVWQLDLNSLELVESPQPVESPQSVESRESTLALELLPEKMVNKIGGGGVTTERLLLDLHSGRLFGKPGVLFVDFFALIFLFLSLSGMYFYLKQLNR